MGSSIGQTLVEISPTCAWVYRAIYDYIECIHTNQSDLKAQWKEKDCMLQVLAQRELSPAGLINYHALSI